MVLVRRPSLPATTEMASVLAANPVVTRRNSNTGKYCCNCESIAGGTLGSAPAGGKWRVRNRVVRSGVHRSPLTAMLTQSVGVPFTLYMPSFNCSIRSGR